MLEKNVLWFQITVNNTQSKQCTKALQNGVCHLADEWWTEATKLSTLKQLIQVDAKQFESDADMSSEDELLQNVNHIKLVFSILSLDSTPKTLVAASHYLQPICRLLVGYFSSFVAYTITCRCVYVSLTLLACLKMWEITKGIKLTKTELRW